LFARSYVQYIATKSGEPDLLAGLNVDRKALGELHYPTQWDDADFVPIMAAFDELFKGLGWIK
jgi:hypothetical protein